MITFVNARAGTDRIIERPYAAAARPCVSGMSARGIDGPAAKRCRAEAMRVMGKFHSFRFSCRNRIIVGYHEVSWRLGNQRQSGECWTSSQTGLPNAPARCATAVSTVMTKSKWAITDAVSKKSLKTKVAFKTSDKDSRQDLSRAGMVCCRL